MIIPTRDNFGSSSCNTSDTYRDAAEDIAAGKQTLDPALLAAKLLLGRAMEEAGTTPEQVGADGMVSVVIVANSEWTQVVCRAWCDIARGGQRWEDGDRAYVRGARTWLAWVSNEALRPVVAKESNEIVAKAVSQARHCAGFSPDAAWLPTDLVYTADYRLTLPKLTGNDVGRIAAELCGSEPTTCLSDDDAASLTPRLLRLVRRPNQGSAGYVAKLADLLDRDRPTHSPPSAATSPRDEPTLDRLHGMDEAVAWGLDLVRDLGAFGRDELDWTSVDKGCLLSGPPGCGKTLFARALATTCNVALVTGSYGRWLGSGSGHQGDLLKAMSKTFTEARSKTPCILFIDEVDSFPNRSTLTHHYADWEIQVVNALLAEIDGVEGRAGVVLVGQPATTLTSSIRRSFGAAGSIGTSGCACQTAQRSRRSFENIWVRMCMARRWKPLRWRRLDRLVPIASVLSEVLDGEHVPPVAS